MVVGVAYKAPPPLLSIVWGRFPYDEAPHKPAADCHPCLVLRWNELRNGDYSVLVVFGTSNMDRVDKTVNFFIANYAAMNAAGLNKTTLFDLGRSRWLHWSDAWFVSPDPARWVSPIIGRVPDDRVDFLRHQLQYRERIGLPVPPKWPSPAKLCQYPFHVPLTGWAGPLT